MQTDISIVGMGSISPLGAKPEQVVHSYGYHDHLLVNKAVGDTLFPVGQLCEDAQQQIALLREESPKYKSLDPSVLYAIYAARQALAQAGWPSDKDFGVNIGSSRGATTLLEAYHKDFLDQGKCPPLASPTTSLGNIASWVMQDAKGQGIAISHSITCSTALHALVNAVAWLKADMAEAFLVGGSEAPLTSFTLAQMKALKIYADPCDPYPCQPLKQDKSKSTMALGEGAAVFAFYPFGSLAAAGPGGAGGRIAVFGGDFGACIARSATAAGGENVLLGQAILLNQGVDFAQGFGQFVLAGLFDLGVELFALFKQFFEGCHLLNLLDGYKKRESQI